MHPFPASLRILLEGLIDYAGLFPPAGLEMPGAVANFAAYRADELGWALGRFIVPVGRLDEFEGAGAALFPRSPAEAPWLISMLAGRDAAHDAELIFAFNERHAHTATGRVVIDTLETRADTVAGIESAVRSVPSGVTVYVEIPITEDPSDLLAALAGTDARAKVRTGGVTYDAFPAVRDVARFIRGAADQGVPFKATAGLHHPVRASHPLTYAPDSPSGVMYGYLNVFMAAALAQQGLSIGELEPLLEETDPHAFAFDDQAAGWRGQRADLDTLTRLRTRTAISFGSCSFVEPTEELTAILR